MNYIIIEDEPQAVKVLEAFMKKHFGHFSYLGHFDKISTASAFITSNPVDFIFLDIQLNGELGIDISNHIKREDLNFEIIFTTAYSGFALEAFAISAVDYLLKPLKEDRLTEAVERVIKRRGTSFEQLKILQEVSTTEKIERLVLSMTEKKILVHLSDILFLKADNVYTEFHLNDGKKHVVSRPLKEYEMLLTQEGFYKPHRSFIINTKGIKAYHKGQGEIEMKNGFKVSLARDNKKVFEEKYI